jgi:hypothetical protein
VRVRRNSPEIEGNMEMWSFEVTEQLQGYVRTTQKQKWVDPRYKRYLGWKGLIRLLANVAGVPDELPRDSRAVVSCAVTWNRKARLDGDNFLKGILDSLWRQDRRVMELHYAAFEGAGKERAVITVGLEVDGVSNGKRD